MPNSNYLKGVRKERKIVNEARSRGHIAFRSAGSHSPIDVCIIDRKYKIITLIQCKPDNFAHSKKLALEKEMQDLKGVFVVDFEVA